MPELPEVETIKRGLDKLLPNLTVEQVSRDNLKSFPNSLNEIETFLIHSRIKSVNRRAKVLIINLSSNYSLVIHLKMTGQLVFVNQQLLSSNQVRFGGGHPSISLIASLPDKSTRVTFQLSNNNYLFFNDQRKFGWIKLLPTPLVPELPFYKKYGPEPLDQSFSAKLLEQQLLRRPRSRIKPVLLDQTIIAGIGNIYADESLWLAKIHPATIVGNLSKKDIRALYQAIKSVLQLSIDKGGSTDRNYINAEGGKGSYLAFAAVFRKEGQPCKRCQHTISKIRLAGRGTHLCLNCQKLKN